MFKIIALALSAWLASVTLLVAQRTPAVVQQEIQQAQKDAPQLIDVLNLQAPMTVADIGAGFGAMAHALATRLGPTSRIYVNDIESPQLDALKELAAQDKNIVVAKGGDRSTNLPDACCDAIYMRDVYHHFTQPADMNKSLFVTLKSGGRLAVIDFEPAPGSKLPEGVAANRGGHGIPPAVLIDEVTAAGFTYERTISHWPEPEGGYFLVLFRKP